AIHSHHTARHARTRNREREKEREREIGARGDDRTTIRRVEAGGADGARNLRADQRLRRAPPQVHRRRLPFHQHAPVRPGLLQKQRDRRRQPARPAGHPQRLDREGMPRAHRPQRPPQQGPPPPQPL
ncbi:hypothetical protein BRADI_3g46114v3, partial [Brachypodium distachyon]